MDVGDIGGWKWGTRRRGEDVGMGGGEGKGKRMGGAGVSNAGWEGWKMIGNARGTNEQGKGGVWEGETGVGDMGQLGDNGMVMGRRRKRGRGMGCVHEQRCLYLWGKGGHGMGKGRWWGGG